MQSKDLPVGTIGRDRHDTLVEFQARMDDLAAVMNRHWLTRWLWDLTRLYVRIPWARLAWVVVLVALGRVAGEMQRRGRCES